MYASEQIGGRLGIHPLARDRIDAREKAATLREPSGAFGARLQVPRQGIIRRAACGNIVKPIGPAARHHGCTTFSNCLRAA